MNLNTTVHHNFVRSAYTSPNSGPRTMDRRPGAAAAWQLLHRRKQLRTPSPQATALHSEAPRPMDATTWQYSSKSLNNVNKPHTCKLTVLELAGRRSFWYIVQGIHCTLHTKAGSSLSVPEFVGCRQIPETAAAARCRLPQIRSQSISFVLIERPASNAYAP